MKKEKEKARDGLCTEMHWHSYTNANETSNKFSICFYQVRAAAGAVSYCRWMCIACQNIHFTEDYEKLEKSQLPTGDDDGVFIPLIRKRDN